MASQVMRVTLKAYDHKLVDQSAGKIIETVKKTGSHLILVATQVIEAGVDIDIKMKNQK